MAHSYICCCETLCICVELQEEIKGLKAGMSAKAADEN